MSFHAWLVGLQNDKVEDYGVVNPLRTKEEELLHCKASNDRTIFKLQAVTEQKHTSLCGRPEKDQVMIRSDQITITVIGQDDGHVRSENGVLVPGGSGCDPFFFSDFKTASLPSGVSGDAVMKKFENDGDEWELAA
ncbi:hypothetical protein BDV34DRAFT_226397 [Aspergillus parasiticus]|uniref:Uncharacterized protein n=1 Tax=Aspergillus parasiticus TaxID=5067 RepID=A0A5N6DJS6_ASPPA|nr:hypothetical protein BDV34DRAFT_226397 [Aspergillus parasiticus]